MVLALMDRFLLIYQYLRAQMGASDLPRGCSLNTTSAYSVNTTSVCYVNTTSVCYVNTTSVCYVNTTGAKPTRSTRIHLSGDQAIRRNPDAPENPGPAPPVSAK